MKLADESLYLLGACVFQSLNLKEILPFKYGFKTLSQTLLFRKDKS